MRRCLTVHAVPAATLAAPVRQRGSSRTGVALTATDRDAAAFPPAPFTIGSTLSLVATSAGFPATAENLLRSMQAITDAPPAPLDVDDLLGELLDRVREILEVDTAAVLLLDPSGQQLVATAASGLEDEIRQGTRLPVGKGFAGRVAAEQRPVIIENVGPGKVLNPLLLDKGLHSLLGVPLVAHGRPLGVLHVGTLTTRRFTDGDVELLQLAADHAATAVQSLATRAERAAARELQRSLLPAALPAIPGVEAAARYVPGAASVSGDWYDVFTLPSGELCVAMGDVAGHGLGAAVVMGRMRSALRAYALESDDPAEVLHRLDRKIEHFEPGAMATVLYALCHPALRWARVSVAGHLPLVLACPGRPAAPLDIAPDLPIGVDDTAARRSVTVQVPPGAVLCLYTDGLVERRNRSLDAGLSRLYESISAGPPETICATVMAALIGHDPVKDDVALLVLRRVPAN
jgi:putative methionine-R-sulfoxide reductase with GAF domain